MKCGNGNLTNLELPPDKCAVYKFVPSPHFKKPEPGACNASQAGPGLCQGHRNPAQPICQPILATAPGLSWPLLAARKLVTTEAFTYTCLSKTTSFKTFKLYNLNIKSISGTFSLACLFLPIQADI